MKRWLSFLLLFAVLCSGAAVRAKEEQADSTPALAVKPYGQMKYVKSTGILSGIAPQTSLQDVLNGFENSGAITVCDANEDTVSSGNVATGWTFSTGKDTATAVIFGDVNSDAKINGKDVLLARLYATQHLTLSDAQVRAMDVNADQDSGGKDILFLRQSLVGLTSIRNSALYYVAKTGSDTNDGSETAPFLTVQQAASVMTAGDTCLIREGIYRETVTPKNEGEAGAPITFMADQDESVTVSGTEVIDSEWEAYQDGIYKTNFYLWRRTENQLFVNGEMAQIARYPNKESENVIAVGNVLSADSASDSQVSAASLSQPDGYFTGAKIFIEGTSHYIYYSSTVTEHSAGNVSFETIASGWDSPTTDSNFYFYDALNLLDTADEWYYDGNGTLYYKPEAGVAPDTLHFEYSVRPDAFDVRDRSYITVKGLEIFGANVKTNAGSDHLHLDENAILYYYHTVQSRYYPWEAEWYGLELWGESSVVENCEIAYSAEGGVEIYADNCSVVNNNIHDINYINSNAAAVEGKYCENTLISHNTIDNIARSGIVLSCKNMRVSYNKISNCAVNMYDVSGIGAYKFDAENTVEVDHNIVFDSNDGHAFVAYYLDNGSMNFLLHHNVCYDVDLAMILNNPSYNNRIYNNTFLSEKPIATGNMQNPFDNNAFIGARWDGDQFYNNILPSVYYGTGAFYSNNLLSTDPAVKLNDDMTLQSGSAAIDRGIKLPVGGEDDTGDRVDIGAYAFGQTPWTAGCDWSRRFDTAFSLTPVADDFTPVSGDMFLEMEQPGTAIIENSSFENTMEGWDGFGYENITGNASHGDWAVRIQEGWIERIFDVQPGQMYLYSGDIKVGAFETVAEFGVHFLDDDYNILNQGSFMVTTTDYHSFETVFTVPEGCTKMRVFAASWGGGQEVFADHIQCALLNE